MVGVTTEITLTAAGAEAETETALRLLLLLLPHRRGAVDERAQVRCGAPVGPERASRRRIAGSSRLPRVSRALRAQMRPAAACRVPYFAGAASAVCYCVGECVGECVGDVHDLPKATRVAQPLQKARHLRRLRPPDSVLHRVSSSGRCRCCRSCCRCFWRRS